jgi:hypothetical protein
VPFVIDPLLVRTLISALFLVAFTLIWTTQRFQTTRRLSCCYVALAFDEALFPLASFAIFHNRRDRGPLPRLAPSAIERRPGGVLFLKTNSIPIGNGKFARRYEIRTIA